MGKHFTAWEKAEMERLKKEGYNQREIGEQLGYSRMQIKEYFHRLYKKQRMDENRQRMGMIPEPQKRRGRPRKTLLTPQRENELRIKELEREVELLRSFLRAAGRG